MTATNTALRQGKVTRILRSIPLKALEIVHKNDLIIWVNASTYAVQGYASGSALQCMGVCLNDATGGAADGDVTIDVVQGEFELTNSATNVITVNDVAHAATAYIEGVGTVGNVAGTATAAGPIVGLNGSNPIVRIEY